MAPFDKLRVNGVQAQGERVDRFKVNGVGYPCDMSGRIIALDLGKARSGVAVSDPTQTIAQPLDLLPGADAPTFVEQLGGVVAEYEAERVIVGIPRTMDGRMGEMARWAEGIRRRLRTRAVCTRRGQG